MKSFISIICFLSGAMQIFAQDGIHAGFGIIPQSTWISNLQDEDTDLKSFTYKATWGYTAYGKLGYNFGPPLGLHAYILYSKQGQNHTSEDPNGTLHHLKRDLTYVKIPIMLAINSHNGSSGRKAQKILFCFGGGPYISYLVAANYTDNGVEKYPGLDVKQLFKPRHFGAAYYIGWDFMLAGDVIYLNARIQGDASFGNIENKDFIYNGAKFYPENRPTTHNLNFGINCGLTFVIPVEGSGGSHWR